MKKTRNRRNNIMHDYAYTQWPHEDYDMHWHEDIDIKLIAINLMKAGFIFLAIVTLIVLLNNASAINESSVDDYDYSILGIQPLDKEEYGRLYEQGERESALCREEQ